MNSPKSRVGGAIGGGAGVYYHLIIIIITPVIQLKMIVNTISIHC